MTTKLEAVLAEEWESSPVKDDVAVAHAYKPEGGWVENVKPADRQLRAAVAILGRRALALAIAKAQCEKCAELALGCSKHYAEELEIVEEAGKLG